MAAPKRQWDLWALSGILFAAFFLLGGVLMGALAQVPLPMPDAPVTDVARYYEASRTASLAQGTLHVLSALSLLVFVAPVATLARRVAGERSVLPALTSGGGVLAVVFLLASALLGLVLALTAGGLGLDLVGTLRQMNFLTGGTLHVASLGLFVGATSIAARRTKALPRWISWLGIAQATLAILSLASLVFFPAALFILLGRLLGFVWCIGVGIVLALGRQRDAVVGG